MPRWPKSSRCSALVITPTSPGRFRSWCRRSRQPGATRPDAHQQRVLVQQFAARQAFQFKVQRLGVEGQFVMGRSPLGQGFRERGFRRSTGRGSRAALRASRSPTAQPSRLGLCGSTGSSAHRQRTTLRPKRPFEPACKTLSLRRDLMRLPIRVAAAHPPPARRAAIP